MKKNKNVVLERQNDLFKYIEKVRRVQVNDLILRFNVSPSTLRTDLATLEKNGQIRRSHGWAMSQSVVRVGDEYLSSSRISLNAKYKMEIANAANRLVSDGDIIAVLAGTTSMYFARTLTNKNNLTIVLNDIDIAKWLNDNTDHNLLMVGGFIRKHYSYIDQNFPIIESMNMDKAFFSCAGFSLERGATVSDFRLAESQRKIIERANHNILLCDSSKIGEVYFANICAAENVNTLITDQNISQENQELLEQNEDLYLYVANEEVI